jgi:hypothetical protein
MTTKQPLLTRTALLTRGWTAAGIAKFLDPPDVTKPNPRYHSAAPMHLYDETRVKQTELTTAFIDWKTKSDVRKTIAAKAIATKKRILTNIAANWKPVITTKHINIVRKEAIENYNDFHYDHKQYSVASNKSDPSFLERITVNYIRHDLTDYDGLLYELHGKIGIHEAIELVRDRVYDTIAAAYPNLSDECNRQRSIKARLTSTQ